MIQPAPAPKLALKLTGEEIYQQAKLPGMWKAKGEAAEDEGETEEKEE